MVTKRSGVENHSCVDFLKGEVSELKQVIQDRDEAIEEHWREIIYFRKQNEDNENDFWDDYYN